MTFNYIFGARELNSQLGNNWVPKKLEILVGEELPCEYSKMITMKLDGLNQEFLERAGDDYRNELDLFFARDFKDLYINYTKLALEDIIKRIKCYKSGIEAKNNNPN